MKNPFLFPAERLAAMRDAERNALSFVFLAQRKATDAVYGHVLPDMFARLTVEDFEGQDNAAVFEAMKSLYDAGKEINTAAVAEEVTRLGKMKAGEAINKTTAIYNDGTATIAGAADAVEIVKRNAAARQAVDAMADAAAGLIDGTADDDAAGVIGNKLLEIDNKRRGAEIPTSQEFWLSVVDELVTEYGMTPEQIEAARFWFDSDGLNRLTQGMERGSVWTLAAISGAGKTTFAAQTAAKLAFDGKKVVYITSEVTDKRMARRVLSNAVNISYGRMVHTLGKDKFHGDEWQRIIDTVGKGDILNLNIQDTNELDKIEGIVRTQIARQALDVLIIDHIQLMQIRRQGGRMTDNERYAAVIETLKKWALQYNIVVFALSQVNRLKDYRGDDDTITMDSLYGSSTIAMFSDGIIALNRIKDDPTGRTRVDVIKCRDGILGKVWMRFDGRYQRLVDDTDANMFDGQNVNKQQRKTEEKAKTVKKKRKFSELPPKVQAKIKEQRFQQSCNDLFDPDSKKGNDE